MYRALAIIPLLFATNAWASEKLNYPQVVKDRMQVEYLGFVDQESSAGDRYRSRVQTTYGLTDRIDLAVSYVESTREGGAFQALGPSVRLKYELTKQGDWWLSSGVQTRYTHDTDGQADTLNTRFILQHDAGNWLTTANFSAIRGIGENRSPSIALTGAAQVIYQLSSKISPGVEFFHTFGSANDLDYTGRRSQEIGPIVAGTLPIDEEQSLAYVMGYYRGLSANSPEQSGKLQVNYVRQF